MMDSRDLDIVDFPAARFPRLHGVLAEAIEDRVTPGLVAGLWEAAHPDRIRLTARGVKRLPETFVGAAPPPADSRVGPETIFDLASVSKVMATATLAAGLIERGWLDWTTPVAAILPDYPYPRVEVRHLLAHTAGYAAWQPYYEAICARFGARELYRVSVGERQRAMRGLVLATAPERAVGEAALYSDISYLVLGFVLEAVTGLPLDQAVARLLWRPLGVRDAFYVHTDRPPGEAARADVAATESGTWRGATLQGQVHDDNCWAMGGYGGHAGVFGTARDVLWFARRLQLGFLSAATRRVFWSRAAEPPGCSRTPGWDTPSGEPSSAGRFFSPLSVGHLGYTGTSLWIDPAAGLAVTLLTNRVHPSRDNQAIRQLRPRFHDALRGDLAALPDARD